MDEVLSAGLDSIRILTVDDHRVFRSRIAAFLATQPDVKLLAETSNGREAIHQFRQHRPDIILMDLQMPEMNGLDAMIAIRNEFPEAKIIILTTFAGDVPGRYEAGGSGVPAKSSVGQATPRDHTRRPPREVVIKPTSLLNTPRMRP